MNHRFFFHAVVLAALASSTAACNKQAPHGDAAESEEASFGKLTVDDLVSRMNDAKAGKLKLAVFDNNQHDVFNKGHIPGARWVDFKNVQASDLPADKDTELVFYCANEH